MSLGSLLLPYTMRITTGMMRNSTTQILRIRASTWRTMTATPIWPGDAAEFR